MRSGRALGIIAVPSAAGHPVGGGPSPVPVLCGTRQGAYIKKIPRPSVSTGEPEENGSYLLSHLVGQYHRRL